MKTSVISSKVLILISIIMLSKSNVQEVTGQSIYNNSENKELIYKLYDEKLSRWPVSYENIDVETTYGKTNIIASGDINNPAVFLIHPMGLTATVWLPNVAALSEHYRVYAVNTIGDLGKSELADYDNYPRKGINWSEWLEEIMAKLEINRCDVIAGSMGGWISMNFAIHSRKVDHLVLLGPMGIKSNTLGVMSRLMGIVLFPTERNKKALTKWVLGDSQVVNDELAIYMNTAMNCAGRLPTPSHIKKKELKKIESKTLLVLGEHDNAIGNPKKNLRYANKHFRNIEVVVMNSGHIISMQKAEQINPLILSFLAK